MTVAELAIGGTTCASCAARIERKLNRLDGVSRWRPRSRRWGAWPLHRAALAFSSVFVVGNSLRLRRWRPRADR